MNNIMNNPDWRSLCAELLETIDMLLVGDRRPESERGAYIRSLLAQPELEAKRIDLDAIKQAIEERDEAALQYYHLAQNMVYRGNSVAHWHDKAKAYRDAIGKVWNELLAAGIACDGNKSCADGVRELAARKVSDIEPVPVAERMPGPEDCDRYGQCWFWCKAVKTWDFRSRNRQMVHDTHWLPHHALPVPEDCEENKG